MWTSDDMVSRREGGAVFRRGSECAELNITYRHSAAIGCNGEMNNTPLLHNIFPLGFGRYSELPIFGSYAEDFVRWLEAQSYARRSIRGMMQGTYILAQWLQKRRIGAIHEVTPEVLAAADAHFRHRPEEARLAGRAIHRFLRERELIPAPRPPRLAPAQEEAGRYVAHLHEVRGLADRSIGFHRDWAAGFLEFIGFNDGPTALPQLRHDQIEGFVRRASRTRSRVSLRNVVLVLRAFLRFEFHQGVLPRPLHEQVDMPRVYSGERLPRVLTRDQVRAFLRSIDLKSPNGVRDFTMLYLIAVYGLRRSEVVALRLDDIDWRARILHVRQSKTQQSIALPLTDEAGHVLARYLRKARPKTEPRELFVRTQAPAGPLTPWAVNLVLLTRLQRSGLDLKFSPHTLRHSLAVHLLRRGVSMKAIGDTLGHRDLRSTACYLRLNLDDLRAVGLPVLQPAQPASLLRGHWQARFPKVCALAGPRPRSKRGYRSAFGRDIEQFVAARRTLGRKYVTEECTLRAWDAFLHQQKAKSIDGALFHRWAESIRNLCPKTQRRNLSLVRSFLAYYAREYSLCFVPDSTTFPKAAPRRPPRLVSSAEMERLLATAGQLQNRKSNPVRSDTVQIGLMLLFCCGLRAGELLRLKLRHYDAADQLLRIEVSKFNKSRLVPLAPSVARALERYIERRRGCGLPTQPESILMWCGRLAEPKAGYTLPALTEIWKRLCLSVGVIDERGRPPRLHDLRHSFAVEALHRWYTEGANVQSRLPNLAAYLGHTGPASSHYYLQLTTDLRSAASERFHRVLGDLTKTGGVR